MLKDTLKQDLLTAMKNRKTEPNAEVRLRTIRSVLSAITEFEKSKGQGDVQDGDILNILKKAVKQREETVQIYKNAGETERADKEQAEIQVLRKYLPKQLTEAETTELVQKIIADISAESMRDMGKVMKQLKSLSNVDMGVASKIVKNSLSH